MPKTPKPAETDPIILMDEDDGDLIEPSEPRFKFYKTIHRFIPNRVWEDPEF